MSEHNVATVSVVVSENGNGLNTTIAGGITATTFENGVQGFIMKTRSGPIRFRDGKKLASMVEGKFVNAGFYIKEKEHKLKWRENPFYFNIGGRYDYAPPTDMEVLLHVGPEDELHIYSALDTDYDLWETCVNFPKDNREFVGDALVRIPDGAFLQVHTPHFGYVCILNVRGRLTQHAGEYPHPNTKAKAATAAKKRQETAQFLSLVKQNQEKKKKEELGEEIFSPKPQEEETPTEEPYVVQRSKKAPLARQKAPKLSDVDKNTCVA